MWCCGQANNGILGNYYYYNDYYRQPLMAPRHWGLIGKDHETAVGQRSRDPEERLGEISRRRVVISQAVRVLSQLSPVLDNCPTGANVDVMQVNRCIGSAFDAADVSDVRRERRAVDVRSAHSGDSVLRGRSAWSASSVGGGWTADRVQSV